MHHTAQELQAFVNDASRNFSKIRSTYNYVTPIPSMSYHQYAMIKGDTHKVVAHNQMPPRTYPIELPMSWLD